MRRVRNSFFEAREPNAKHKKSGHFYVFVVSSKRRTVEEQQFASEQLWLLRPIARVVSPKNCMAQVFARSGRAPAPPASPTSGALRPPISRTQPSRCNANSSTSVLPSFSLVGAIRNAPIYANPISAAPLQRVGRHQQNSFHLQIHALCIYYNSPNCLLLQRCRRRFSLR